MLSKGLVIGGILPALLYGTAGLLQKAAMRAGVGPGPYLLAIGVGVLAIGGAATWTAAVPARVLNLRAALLSAAVGAAWAAGMWLVAEALTRHATPLAKLAPLYNLNTLLVVLAALVVFAESRDVAVTRLVLGTVLIVVGGSLVASA